jgi:hypothetical protein
MGLPASRKRQRRAARTPAAVPVTNANRLLYRNSPWVFAAFGAAVLVAFWPSYFSRLGAQPTYHPHAHGIAMTLWCAMLVAQAWLIRTGRRPLHRRLGRLSFVLVPLMVLATIDFLRFRLQGIGTPGPVEFYFMALVLNALAAFLVIYALALAWRRTPPVHARFILCTIFPLFTPVTDRLIGRYLPSVVPLVPRIDGTPVVPVAGFLAADALLAALSIWDWRANRRLVFPVALVVLLLYHASVLTFHRLPLWRAFGEWFVAG